MMLFRAAYVPVLAAVLATTGAAPAATSETSTIRQLSQAFSDASASGDAKVLAKLLDDNVVFLSEDGSIFTKHDIVASAGPPPPGVHNHLVQSGFGVQFHGNVAVTHFTDNATFDVYGQVAHQRFRSTEVWLNEKGDWKMISSQTVALAEDPPHVLLTTAELNQYVGRYAMAPGHALRIQRKGGGLVMIGKSGKLVPLLAEARDVLFVPGQPRLRWIFNRGARGTITGFDLRREGITMQRFKRV